MTFAKMFFRLATLFALLSFPVFAQLTSQGQERVVTYSGSTATLATNLPASNFTTTSGLNTFIMNVSPLSNALRVYLTNDTGVACNNFTISVASSGNPSINSFNNNLAAWGQIQVQSGTGGFVNSQPITLPGNSTVAVTSTPIVASKVVVFVVLSSGCTTTNVDVIVSFGTFSPSLSAVQGIVAPGASASTVNPVLVGGLDNSNTSRMIDVCSTNTATACSGGAGFSVSVGANGNSYGSAGSTGGVTTMNSGAAPLGVAVGGQKSTDAGGSVTKWAAVSGGVQGATSDNPQGLMVSSTGYQHNIATQALSTTTTFALFGLGNVTGAQQGSAGLTSCYVQITTTNTAGTTPTLDVFFQTSGDGVTWNDRIHFNQVTTGSSNQFSGIVATAGITPTAVATGTVAAGTKIDGPIGSFGRIQFVLTGAGATYNASYGVSCQ